MKITEVPICGNGKKEMKENGHCLLFFFKWLFAELKWFDGALRQMWLIQQTKFINFSREKNMSGNKSFC